MQYQDVGSAHGDGLTISNELLRLGQFEASVVLAFAFDSFRTLIPAVPLSLASFVRFASTSNRACIYHRVCLNGIFWTNCSAYIQDLEHGLTLVCIVKTLA